MRTLLLAIVLGSILGVTADLIVTPGPVDFGALVKVLGVSAAKGAFIGWLVPKTIPWLSVALAIGIVFGAFFWTAVPSRGSFPADALRWWNLVPGMVLGTVLVLKSRRKAAEAAERANAAFSRGL
jgi:hypothetical protein